jgi:hypothetical protein
MTIVLPNGYCRVHQDQYVVEKFENTNDIDTGILKGDNEKEKESVYEEKIENIDAISSKSTSYSRNKSCSKHWYVVPVLVFAFLWFIVRLVKQKK